MSIHLNDRINAIRPTTPVHKQGQEQEQVRLEWIDNDPDNPRNWSLRRRILTTLLISGIAFVSTLAASIYAPGHGEVSKRFDVSTRVALLPLSCYNLGLSFGPSVGAPLSETFGRKALYLTTTPIFAFFTLGAGFSQDIVSLVVCRFCAGVFASPAISNAAATIADFSAPRHRAIPLAFYYSIPFFGSVLGPLIGGFVVVDKGWRWTQWTILFFIVAFWLPALFVRESYKKTILSRRTKLARPDDHKQLYQRNVAAAIKYFVTTLLIRPIRMLFTEPIVTLVCLYTAFQFGLLYTFVVASPYVFQTTYNFNMRAQALSFTGFIAGCIVAPAPLIAIDYLFYQKRLNKHTSSTPCTPFPPENRLPAAMLGSLTLPPSLLAFALTARDSIPAPVPIFCQALTITSSLLIYVGASSYMVDTYGPLYGASTQGASMISRYTLSAAFPLFALQIFGRLGTAWATGVLAACAVAMAPIPWVFWRWGPALRRRSGYECSI